MKIGILTFHTAINYGAIFQAYGLQEVLKSKGHEVYIVNYQPNYLRKNYRPFNYTYKHHKSLLFNLKLFLLSLLIYPKRAKRNWSFKKFREQHLQLCSLDDIEQLDLLFLGSDQIWNPQLTGDGFDEMFIGTAPIIKNKKKVAYAASVGSLNVLAKDNRLADALHDFWAISVREHSLSQYLNTKFPYSIPVVLDPVLLAGKDAFQAIARPSKHGTSYLLTFQIGGNLRVSQIGRQIAKNKGLEFVEIRVSADSFKQDIHSTCAPAKVLGYFLDASYVVTSSFHGAALSILFEKSFNVVSINPETDERANMLLHSLGLQDRKINDDTHYDLNMIDYNVVTDLLMQKKQESLNFIIQTVNTSH